MEATTGFIAAGSCHFLNLFLTPKSWPTPVLAMVSTCLANTKAFFLLACARTLGMSLLRCTITGIESFYVACLEEWAKMHTPNSGTFSFDCIWFKKGI